MSSTESFGQKIEDELETTWNDVVSFLGAAESKTISFLQAVESGAAILLADIEEVGQWILGNIGTIQASVTALSGAAATIAPNNSSVSKLVADLQTGVNDAQVVAQTITSGSAANSSTLATDTATAVNGVNTLKALAATLAANLATLANQSSTATQAVSPPTPNEG